MTRKTKIKVLVIVGPTASGKTSLGIKLAQTYNGEVISADSRQVYRGLDLGTGKVTPEEMDGVPHHLIDIADPSDTYTAADFMRDGRAVIADIHARGKLPIIVGGTFFYIDMLLGRITAPDVPQNPLLRAELETLSTEELSTRLTTIDPIRATSIDHHNRRRLIRALEIATARGHVPPPEAHELYDICMLGILIDTETLHKNIHTRLIERLNAGMVSEVETLLAHGLSYERMEELGLEYRYIARHLKGELSYDDMVKTLEIKIRQFAKRQMTWLKRDTSIVWNTTEKHGDNAVHKHHL